MVSAECLMDINFWLWVTVTDKIEHWFLTALLGFQWIWSLLCFWNGGKHHFASDWIHHGTQMMRVIWNHLNSKRLYTLLDFSRFFLKREFKELTCHHLFPRKDVCNFLGSPVTTCKTRKSLKLISCNERDKLANVYQSMCLECNTRSRHQTVE